MDKPVLLLTAIISLFLPFSSPSKTLNTLSQYSSLSPPGDVLVSLPNGVFTAGFYPVGDNAYCFAVWVTEATVEGNLTVVWMANRNQPVNGRKTKLTLDSGNLVLMDAGQIVVWRSGSSRNHESSMHMKLQDNGNLVLQYVNGGDYVWQSFDSPTDTLLPQQLFTMNTKLISSRSQTNYSSGFYKLYFDNDNILRLLYDGLNITSVFWPPPWLNSWEVQRTTYDSSKIAKLDLKGEFVSSDNFTFKTTDFGFGPFRRLTLDHDGNLRAYSLDRGERKWKVTWQSTPEPCKTHGICGGNSLCTYSHDKGPRCSCLPTHKMANQQDWSEGCVPDLEIPCNDSKSIAFLHLSHTEFYGYDIGYYQNYTLAACEKLCLSSCNCKGFQYKFDGDQRFYNCFPKTLLYNGYQSVGFQDSVYVKLHKAGAGLPFQSSIQCSKVGFKTLDIMYKKGHGEGSIKSLLWCAAIVGAFEIMCLIIFLYKTKWSSSASSQGYHCAASAMGFERFTYAELKQVCRNFTEELGRGGGGVVYKGVLSDSRIAAVKCLSEANQGEAEFLAELSLIGRLNHANLIAAWGYCAEGKHRILVYEYAERGSLAENLHSNNLDWSKIFNTALGTAKGLAYLHEECLEWVLHCDVKPQNILLDLDYHPKVADFGLSKLLNRGSLEQLNVSRIRGTRGYMAPEWVLNQPITSKVDVYSYGILVLEMITGRSPLWIDQNSGPGGIEKSLRRWVMEVMNESDDEQDPASLCSWVEKILNPNVRGEYEVDKLGRLVKLAVQCTHENKDARPSMRQVVDAFGEH